MQRLFGYLLFVFLFTAANAQEDSIAWRNLNEQAMLMSYMLEKSDIRGYVEFVHPAVLDMMGGKEQYIGQLENSRKDMKKLGISYLTVKSGTPSAIIQYGNELQCVVPQVVEIKTTAGVLRNESSLIAVSSDEGQTWLFIDTGGKDLQGVKEYFPKLSDELIIPPSSQTMEDEQDAK